MSISKKAITARAHTNIALIKYWGKTDDQLILPQNNSLSLTLNHFYTDTKVKFNPSLKSDQIYINNQLVPKSDRITNFLNLVRNKANIDYFAEVNSYNHVPTSAGLASSASAFAALAAAASKAAGLDLNLKDLSRLARRGSGSATRSIYGGWVEWRKGNDESSYALPVTPSNLKDVKMITIILRSSQKKISSRVGMKRSVDSSPYYPVWKKLANRNLIQAKEAIQSDDLSTLGHIAESNSMRMHALTLSSDPSFSYLNDDSFKVINLVRKIRQENGIPCYFTIDAGPNVKILCRSKYQSRVQEILANYFDKDMIIDSTPGPGVHYL